MADQNPPELNEIFVCNTAHRTLRSMFPRQEVQLDSLRLGFRVAESNQSLFDLDLPQPKTEGEGVGGHLDEWTTIIILNLVSVMIYEASKSGFGVIRNSTSYEALRRQITNKAGRARVFVATWIDLVREQILESLNRDDDLETISKHSIACTRVRRRPTE